MSFTRNFGKVLEQHLDENSELITQQQAKYYADIPLSPQVSPPDMSGGLMGDLRSIKEVNYDPIKEQLLQAGADPITLGYGYKTDDPNTIPGGLTRGLRGGFAGVYGGIGDYTNANWGVGKNLGNWGHNAVKKYSSDKIYSVTDRIPFASDYWTSPQGAAYEIGQAAGSTAALIPAIVAASAIVPEAAITAGTAGLFGRLGFNRLAKYALSERGQKAIKWGTSGAIGKTPEAASEGGHVARELAETGEYTPDQIRSIANKVALNNVPWLMAEGAVEMTGLTGALSKLAGRPGKSMIKNLGRNLMLNVPIQSLTEGATELKQQMISNEATGKPHGRFFSPSSWTPEEEAALGAGLVGGGVFGTAGSMHGLRGSNLEQANNAPANSPQGNVKNFNYQNRKLKVADMIPLMDLINRQSNNSTSVSNEVTPERPNLFGNFGEQVQLENILTPEQQIQEREIEARSKLQELLGVPQIEQVNQQPGSIILPGNDVNNTAGIQAVNELVENERSKQQILPTAEEVMMQRQMLSKVKDRDFSAAAGIARDLGQEKLAQFYDNLGKQPHRSNPRITQAHEAAEQGNYNKASILANQAGNEEWAEAYRRLAVKENDASNQSNDNRDTTSEQAALPMEPSQVSSNKSDQQVSLSSRPQVNSMPEYSINKTKHTKTNKDLWVLKLKDKVSKEDFDTIRTTLKPLGGAYSRFTRGFNFNYDPSSTLQPAVSQGGAAVPSQTSSKIPDTTVAQFNELEATIDEIGQFKQKVNGANSVSNQSRELEPSSARVAENLSPEAKQQIVTIGKQLAPTKSNEIVPEFIMQADHELSSERQEIIDKLHENGVDNGKASKAADAILRDRRKNMRVNDSVTGYQKGEYRNPTLDRAWNEHEETGRDFAYADVDFSNLGGLNAHAGTNSAADVHVKAVADIVKQALIDAGMNKAQFFRHGGDEWSVLVPDIAKETLDNALNNASIKVNEYAKANDLDKIYHPKLHKNTGIGIYYGVQNISDVASVSKLIADAEQGTAESKKNLKGESGNVDGNTIRESGAVALEGQPAGTRQSTSRKKKAPGQPEPYSRGESNQDSQLEGQGSLPGDTINQEKSTETATTATSYEVAVTNISDWVVDQLNRGKKFNAQELFAASIKAFGGTQAQGTYTPKDAYDAMELGINKYILSHPQFSPNVQNKANAKEAIKQIKEQILDNIPTQTKRTAEQDEFQQFSTPPTLGYVAAWVSGVNAKDVMIEPSAGIGGLAVFAKAARANVVVNEFSPRRASIVKQMGFDRVFTENAEQLDNIIPDDIKPTVVVMNPPFSATAGRMQGKRETKNATLHIEQALKRLEPNGRLVAIVGNGMADNAPAFKSWWTKIKNTYNVRANVGIDGSNYAKYGTTFDNNLLVIDKTGSTVNTITGTFTSLDDVIEALEVVRDERQQTERANSQPQSASSKQNSQEVSQQNQPAGRSVPGKGSTEHLQPDGMGVRERRGSNANADRDRGNIRPDTKDNLRQSSESEPGNESNSVRLRHGRQQDTVISEKLTEAKNAGGRSTDSDRAVNSVEGQLAGGQSSATGDGKHNITVKKKVSKAQEKELTDSTFDDYAPQKLEVAGAKPHPSPLVQSAAMAAVEPPVPTYSPNLPKDIITKGKLSIAQLEPIVYAGQAFEQTLPSDMRKGYFIGDGTGVGKGREISGIIMDSLNSGKKKAVWVSKNDPLFDDAVRDWTDIGGKPEQLFPINKTKLGEEIVRNDGVVFVTYPTLAFNTESLASGEVKTKQGKASRLDQIVKWLGKDFDGVIAFDEAHMMANSVPTKGSRGTKKASNRGLVGVELQKLLPNARIVYVSATGATEVENLAYASRLGLWGEGTPFSDVNDFITQIKASGLAAMELVARDMKALGVYIARNLSFDGVTYSTLTHDLSADQQQIYNTMAKGWQVVLQNIHAALKATGAVSEDGKVQNANAKRTAMGQFWGSQQRFFNQILTSMQMPAVVEDVRKQLKDGNAVVMQLVNTNEATQDRAIANMEEGSALEDLDMTPRDILMQFIDKSFPVEQYETYTDETGNKRSRAVVDSKGNPVINRQALRLKEALMNRLGSMKVPEGPLEIIINTFGTKMVGEVTGRKRRVVREADDSGHVVAKIQNRSKAHNKADVKAFLDGKKSILIFSEAGGTGQSFHAGANMKNKGRRIHYLIQPGWRADSAVQGFGRTHRSGEVSQPHYTLVTTNLKGQKRFISTIARRLDQLGALTKGQRDAGNQGLFNAKDNLESQYARDALQRFYENLMHNVYADLDAKQLLIKMGLESVQETENQSKRSANSEILRDVPKFLNRLLTLEAAEQNKVFDYFADILDQIIDTHVANGTLDAGMETLRADGVQVKEEKTVFSDPNSSAETKYIELEVKHKNEIMDYDKALRLRNLVGFYQNEKSGKVWAVRKGTTKTNERGAVIDTYVLHSQATNRYRSIDEYEFKQGGWKRLKDTDSKSLWEDAVKSEPEYRTETMHMISGAILPIWDRLPQGQARVLRVQADDGQILLGRVIRERDITETLKKLGASRTINYSVEDLYKKIMDSNYEVELSNGWKLGRRRVSGENRIEILGEDLWKYDKQFSDNGIIKERIQWATRFFIPTGEAFQPAFAWLTKNRQVADVIPPASKKLYSGIDPTGGKFDDIEIVAELKKLGSNMKKAMPKLIELGKSLSDQGYTGLNSWAKKMRETLGDLWDTYKTKLPEVWRQVKIHIDLRNEIAATEDVATAGLTPEQAIREKIVESAKNQWKKKGIDSPFFKRWFGNWTEYAKIKKENISFAKQLDDWENGNLHPRKTIRLGSTPDVLLKLGAKQLPVEISQSVVAKITKQAGDEGGKHDIPLDTLKNLPEQLHDPIMVLKSATTPKSLVVLTELIDQQGKSIIAVIRLEGQHGKHVVNAISSVYGKDNETRFISEQIKQRNLLYLNTQKSRAWSQARGLQLPPAVTNNRGSIKSIILTEKDVVNSYKSSKVVDHSGNPVIVYHGTKSKFSSFDPLRGDTPGVWFGTDIKDVRSFGNVVKVYLSIKNPGTMRDFLVARKKAVADGFSPEKNKKAFNRAVISELKQQGFDGLHSTNFRGAGGKEVWVAFSPEQIKAVNNVGTFETSNPNVRYKIEKGNSKFTSVTKWAGKKGYPDGLYYRYVNSNSPMSDYGHAMFAENHNSVEHYGKNLFVFDGSNAISTEKIKGLIRKEWKKSQSSGDFGSIVSSDIENLTANEVAESFDPQDIVDSADAYDNGDMLSWLWEKVLEPNNIQAVITNDGAIVFNENLVYKATIDEHGSVTYEQPERGSRKAVNYQINNNQTPEMITITQLKEKFPTFKFEKSKDGFLATTPTGKFVKFKLNTEIQIDLDVIRNAYGDKVAKEVEQGSAGAVGRTVVMQSEHGNVSWGAVVELAKAADLGVVDHETIHVVRGMGLISENEWSALKRKYDPQGKLNEAELEEVIADAYSDWNKKPHRIFSKIQRFFRDLYDLIVNPDVKRIYQDISSGKVWKNRSKSETEIMNAFRQAAYAVRRKKSGTENSLDEITIAKSELSTPQARVIIKSLEGKGWEKTVNSNGSVTLKKPPNSLVQPTSKKVAVKKPSAATHKEPIRKADAIPKMEFKFKKSGDIEHISRREIVDRISSLFAPVRWGRSSESAVYKKYENIIRSQKAYDFPQLLRSIGDLLDKHFNLSKLPHATELNGRPISDFFIDYITGRTAGYAKFTKEFETAIGGRMGAVRTIQDMMYRWYNQSSSARIEGVISWDNKEKWTIKALTSKTKAGAKYVYQQLFESRSPINDAVKEIEKVIGSKLPAKENPYIQALLMRGLAGKANVLLGIDKRSGVDLKELRAGLSSVHPGVDFTDFVPLSDILSSIGADKNEQIYRELFSYTVAKHMLTVASVKDSPLEYHDWENNVNSARPEIVKAGQQIVNYSNTLLDISADYGIISRGKVDKLREVYPDYVPLFREFEDAAFEKLGNSLMENVGSRRNIVNPAESIVHNTFKLLDKAEHNKAKQLFANVAKKHENIGWLIEKVPEKTFSEKEIPLESVAKTIVRDKETYIEYDSNNEPVWEKTDSNGNPLDDDGNTVIVNKDDAGSIKVYAKIPKRNGASDKDSVFKVLVEGKAEFYQTTPEVYKALQFAGVDTSNLFLKILSKFVRVARAGFVSLNPEFLLVNAGRDMVTSYLNSPTKSLIPKGDFARGLYHVAKQDKIWWEYVSSGTAMSDFYSTDRNFSQEAIEKIRKTGLFNNKLKALNPKTYLEIIERAGQIIENAPRVGEFMREKDEGFDLTERAANARDLTVDFGKGGPASIVWNKISVFAKVSLLDWDKTFRVLFTGDKDTIMRTWTKHLIALTIPSLILWFMFKDDDRYKKLPQWRKDLFWNIPISDDYTFSFPKPFLAGTIFATLPVRFAEYYIANNPNGFKGMGNLFESQTPNLLGTFITPWVEHYANRSLFTGKPIVPRSEEGLPPERQYGEHTTIVARKIGELFGVSPRYVDNYIRGHTGGTGTTTTAIADWFYGKNTNAPSKDWQELPIIRRFFTKNYRNADNIEQFYEKIELLEQSHRVAIMDSGITDRKQLLKEVPVPDELKMYRKAKEALKENYDEAYAVRNAGDMSPREKRDRLNQLQRMAVEIADQALSGQFVVPEKKKSNTTSQRVNRQSNLMRKVNERLSKSK